MLKYTKTFNKSYFTRTVMKTLLYILIFLILVLYPLPQSFPNQSLSKIVEENQFEKLAFAECKNTYPGFVIIPTYMFQGSIKYSSSVNKSMDNNNTKDIHIKISNFESLFNPNLNVTKVYISITQLNATSFKSITLQTSYIMCIYNFDAKQPKNVYTYIQPLHSNCFKEINLKGTTSFNPSEKVTYESKNFKLQLNAISNSDGTPKEIKAVFRIGDKQANINDIAMDLSCIYK